MSSACHLCFLSMFGLSFKFRKNSSVNLMNPDYLVNMLAMKFFLHVYTCAWLWMRPIVFLLQGRYNSSVAVWVHGNPRTVFKQGWMCENVGFQPAAGVLMAVFVPRLAAIEALRWSLTSLVSCRKAFRGWVGEDGGVLTLFPLRTETPSVSPTSGQNQTRPYGEKIMELGKERERPLLFYKCSLHRGHCR